MSSASFDMVNISIVLKGCERYAADYQVRRAINDQAPEKNPLKIAPRST
jgi:hypothetical protein